jgi:protein-S-isoprenylcysteine O-methyltransferase Ste14
MSQVVIPFIILGYAVQLIELVFYPLPSDFTTYNIIQKENAGFTKSKPVIAILILGTIISLITFLIPGLLILLPEGATLLHYFKINISSLGYIAVFLIVGGSLITLMGVLKISDSERSKKENALIQTGIFRFTRNPITLGLNAVVIGFLLALPSLEMLAGCIIYILNAHFRVRMEEKQLERKYGKAFQKYKRSVSRYINLKPVLRF